jgi:phosphatidylglycerol:prolipoprotein diacylglycerol transferase
MYGVTFLAGYGLLRYFASTSYFQWLPKLQRMLHTWRDDFFLVSMIGVIVWGRLWEVFLYNPAYYFSNPNKILAIWDGWMSFLWWIVWVIIALALFAWHYKLSVREFRGLGDIIVLVVPLWSLLWRIGNFLNQELVWRPITTLSETMQQILKNIDMTYVFTSVDTLERVNAPIMQSMTEWALLLCILRGVFFATYTKRTYQKTTSAKGHNALAQEPKYWLVAWVFLCGYAMIRFGMEYFKDYASGELYVWWMTRTQILVMLLFICGLWVIRQSIKNTN